MKLTPAQQGYITAIQTAKERYDKLVIEEELRHKFELDKLREPVQTVIRKAQAQGIPNAQVYRNGLGVADYRTFQRFMETVPGSAPTASAEKVAPVEVAAEEFGSGRWEIYPTNHENGLRVVQPNGEEIAVHMYHEGNAHILMSPLKDEDIEDELRDALKAYYPNAATVGAMSEAGAVVNWLA